MTAYLPVAPILPRYRTDFSVFNVFKDKATQTDRIQEDRPNALKSNTTPTFSPPSLREAGLFIQILEIDPRLLITLKPPSRVEQPKSPPPPKTEKQKDNFWTKLAKGFSGFCEGFGAGVAVAGTIMTAVTVFSAGLGALPALCITLGIGIVCGIAKGVSAANE